MSIENMLKNFKTDLELRTFAEAQNKTILDLTKKNKLLIDEVEHLKVLVTAAVPIIKPEGMQTDLSVDSDEKEVARIEIRKLRDISYTPGKQLSLEEAKRLEIYCKILNNTKKEDKKERDVEEIDVTKLIAIAENKSNE